MYLFKLWFPLDICPGVGLLNHMIALLIVFFFFFCASILFSMVAAAIYIPTNSVGRFLKAILVIVNHVW